MARQQLTIYLADLTYTQQGLQSEIMPNAIGGLGTYVQKALGDHIQVRLFKRPEKLIAALQEKTPDVIGFSNYAWNHALSSALATAFKKRHPKVPVIMGGPNYPLDRERQIAFLKEHPQIDFYIIKEGEVAFAKLVGALAENNFDLDADYEIPSVHYLSRDDEAHLPPPIERIKDLAEIPSPYLNGLLDEFFGDGFWPILQTNRGCPFSCTFCVEGILYYNKVYTSSAEKVAAELHYIGKKMAPLVAAGSRADMFIADSNFGMYRDDIATCQAIRDCQDLYSWPQYISVATGKNQKERVLEAARLVRGALRLSGSVQSLDEDVLQNIKRKNVSPDQIMQVAINGAEMGANTYSEVILALPGDTKERYRATISQLIEAGFNKVEAYTLMLLYGSELDDVETRRKFGLKTSYRIIPRCFGHFDYDDDEVSVGEIEEVVIATNTMSFEDYVECRLLALLVVLFHNDGLFEPMLKVIKAAGVPVLDCILGVMAEKLPDGLQRIISDFRAETESELWHDKAELAAFVSRRENIDRYISGELGSNLLFKYKSLAMLGEMEALSSTFADAVARQLAVKLGKLNSVQAEFLVDLSRYCASTVVGIFDRPGDDLSIKTHFDLPGIVERNEFAQLSEQDRGIEREIRFILDDAQKQTIHRLVNTYGTAITGLTRALTRVNVKRLLRRPVGGESDRIAA